MKRLSLLTAALALGGCVNLSGALKDDSGADAYYTLDTRYYRFCRGMTPNCQDLTSIVSVRAQLRPIEHIYGRAVQGPNYPTDLARMIIDPPDGSYTTEAMGSDGRYIRVPINRHTDTVWNTLDSAYDSIYR
ncbi:hypothetical protein [Marinobacterium weihaiense]|uniref:Lipoprotein n=1 Tax=Marinobacterium weihaiense TaxID=2851016 RepID=A0ABS6M9B5_9GAMM|nr:hypothetical protein [Marinobacterium weihaiense]MBV0932486.1 hypothetical protein [Marinobacterium weihaiense]